MLKYDDEYKNIKLLTIENKKYFLSLCAYNANSKENFCNCYLKKYNDYGFIYKINKECQSRNIIIAVCYKEKNKNDRMYLIKNSTLYATVLENNIQLEELKKKIENPKMMEILEKKKRSQIKETILFISISIIILHYIGYKIEVKPYLFDLIIIFTSLSKFLPEMIKQKIKNAYIIIKSLFMVLVSFSIVGLEILFFTYLATIFLGDSILIFAGVEEGDILTGIAFLALSVSCFYGSFKIINKLFGYPQETKLQNEFSFLFNVFPKYLKKDICFILKNTDISKKIEMKENIFEDQVCYDIISEDIKLPYRINLKEIEEFEIQKLNAQQKQILYCIYTRSIDGYIREKYIRKILDEKIEYWKIPFLIKICDEYIIEILEVIYEKLKNRDNEDIENFYRNNKKQRRCVQ